MVLDSASEIATKNRRRRFISAGPLLQSINTGARVRGRPSLWRFLNNSGLSRGARKPIRCQRMFDPVLVDEPPFLLLPLRRCEDVQLRSRNVGYVVAQSHHTAFTIFLDVPAVHIDIVLCGPFADVGLGQSVNLLCVPVGKIERPLQPQGRWARNPVGTMAYVGNKVGFENVL